MDSLRLALVLLALLSAPTAQAAVVRAWSMMHRWPQQTVPYYIDQTDGKWIHKLTEQPTPWTYDSNPAMWGKSIEQTIAEGLAMLSEANPGLRFVRLSGPDAKRFPGAVRIRERPEILITGMATANGFFNGRSSRYEIHINKWNHAGIVAHEMLHILGVSHAQSAANRETYAIVYTGQTCLKRAPRQFTVPDNVRSGHGNFNLLTGRRMLGGYDFDSIMHYSDSIMKKRGTKDPPSLPKVTIGRRLAPGPLKGVEDSLPESGIHYWEEENGNGRSYDAQRSRLSPIDRWALREMYFHSANPESGPDFNGDGLADLILNTDSVTRLLYGGVYSSATPGLNSRNISKAAKRLPFTGKASIAGDFNGDYRMDAAIQTDAGIKVFHAARDNDGRDGELGLLPEPRILRTRIARPSDWATGDFNGDGFSDLALCKPSELGIHFGSSLGLDKIQTLHLDANRKNSSRMGCAAGDFNGDGFTDFALSVRAGSLSIFRGTAQGLNRSPEEIAPASGTAWAATMTVGDFDCDGLQDLAILNANQSITVLHGERRGSGINADSQRRMFIVQAGESLLAADMNGDGYSDLAIGDPFADGVGSVHIINGSKTSLTPSTATTVHPRDIGIEMPEKGGLFGSSLANGDFDGNGYVDLVIGTSGQTVVRYHGSPYDGPATIIGRSFPHHVALSPHKSTEYRNTPPADR